MNTIQTETQDIMWENLNEVKDPRTRKQNEIHYQTKRSTSDIENYPLTLIILRDSQSAQPVQSLY